MPFYRSEEQETVAVGVRTDVQLGCEGCPHAREISMLNALASGLVESTLAREQPTLPNSVEEVVTVSSIGGGDERPTVRYISKFHIDQDNGGQGCCDSDACLLAQKIGDTAQRLAEVLSTNFQGKAVIIK